MSASASPWNSDTSERGKVGGTMQGLQSSDGRGVCGGSSSGRGGSSSAAA